MNEQIYVTVQIGLPIPPWVNKSYGDFGFWKFGLGSWLYAPPNVIVNVPQFQVNFNLGESGTFAGEIEWINTQTFISYPKYPNPVAFRTWFQQGVLRTVKANLTAVINVPDILMAGVPRNLVTGKGMPLIPGGP